MAVPIQFRRGTAAAWTAANPTLLSGEPGVETDTKRSKTGDGVTAWTSLAYDPSAADLTAVTTSVAGKGDIVTPTGSTSGHRAIKIQTDYYSAAFVDPVQFGFKAGPVPTMTGTPYGTSFQALVDATPDSSAAMRNLEDWFATWVQKSNRSFDVRFSPYLFKVDGFQPRQASVYYPNSGLRIKGAGRGKTFWAALPGSSKSAMFGIGGQTNWTTALTIEQMSWYGAGSSNDYQRGVVWCPDYVTEIGFGGITAMYLNDLDIYNFNREQIWLSGGSEDYQVPVQYTHFQRVRAAGINKNYSVWKMTGQIGPPVNFDLCECYGTDNQMKVTASGVTSSTSLPLVEASAINVGMSCMAAGIGLGITVTGVSGNTVTLSGPVTIAGNKNVVFGSITAPLTFLGLDNRSGMVVASINGSAHTITFAEPHIGRRGLRVRQSGGSPWGGLVNTTTDYFLIPVDDFTCKIASSLANAYAGVSIDITGAVGTSTFSVTQVAGVNIGPTQVLMNTPTFQGGGIAVQADNVGDLVMTNPHVEQVLGFVKTGAQGTVTCVGGTSGNAAQGTGANTTEGPGCMYDGRDGGYITVIGAPTGGGNVDYWKRGANVVLPRTGLRTFDHPTTGNGISGLAGTDGYAQLGNSAEINIGTRLGRDFILNAGTTVIKNIRSWGQDGDEFTARVWQAGFVEMDSTGNLEFFGRNMNAGTIRFPQDAVMTFRIHAISGNWTLDRCTMPVHTGSVSTGGSIAGNGGFVSGSITCAGMRIGDFPPLFSTDQAPISGLSITASITSNDTLTVRIVNTNSSAVTVNSTINLRAQQVR